MTAASARARLILGIDGGGSKTVALLADTDGVLAGRGVAGSSNYQTLGVHGMILALEEAVGAAVGAASRQADLFPGPPAALCIGLAGMGRAEDRALLAAWVKQRWPEVPAVLVSDAQLVLAAGTPAGWGVAVICGTGSIVYAEDAQGRQARAGGWGYLLGDEGSGYAVGQSALRAVLRAYDGRDPGTALTQAVLDHWSLAAPPDLVGRVYRQSTPPAEIAELSMLVEATAAQGDAVAQAILGRAGEELAQAARAALAGLGLIGPIPCALAGGLLVHSPALQAAFLVAARGLGLNLDPVTPVAEPAQGTLRLAGRLLDPLQETL